MNTKGCGQTRRVLAVWMASLAWIAVASAQQRAIDTGKSVMIVRVYKAGFLSVLGHNHEIAAPIAGGKVDVTARQVELHATLGAMQVRDPGVSVENRTEIRKTMLGPEVLDTEHHPETIFQSTAAEPKGAGSWRLQGELTLHGQTRPVLVEVREVDGHYVGTSHLKQTDFGIKPVKVAGGAVRVKDEVQIEFDIQLAPR